MISGKLLDSKDDELRLQRPDRRLRGSGQVRRVDPTKVVRAALQDAASVAGLLITTEAAISELPEDKAAAPAMPDMGGMGGMGF